MPASDFVVPVGVTEARNSAASAQQTATSYLTDIAKVPGIVRENLAKIQQQNPYFVEKEAQARENFFAAPSQAGAKYQDTFNPFNRNALINQEVSTAAVPMRTMNSLLGFARPDTASIINESTGLVQAQAAAAQAAADAQARMADQLFKDFITGEELSLRKQEANKKTGGGGGDTMASLLKAIAMLRGGQQPTATDQPTLDGGDGTFSQMSPGSDIFGFDNVDPSAQQYIQFVDPNVEWDKTGNVVDKRSGLPVGIANTIQQVLGY